ncbi:MAG: aminotransferase class IV [Candidatus Thermoplasmatota archaeon]|nr:aminotransferase class IV [Candidatus Thermoplasmatota archaeon]MED5273612.1 aminotransferase class IV [Candidatus Thermoplasmatota archaeon]
MPAPADPNSAVWSAMGWDGEKSLVSAELHFSRIRRHAKVLGIGIPDDLEGTVLSSLEGLEHPGEPNVSPDQANFLLIVEVSSEGEIRLEPRTIQKWPDRPLSAVSLLAPNWEEPVRGTKHGDWEPHRAARKAAVENGADLGLLFENEVLIDGDRCAPLLLDNDGVAYHPRNSDGALDSITVQSIKAGIEGAGIPVRSARITLSMILRASEMVVCGSGMGIRAIGEIDERKIGRPNGPLFTAAHNSWMEVI